MATELYAPPAADTVIVDVPLCTEDSGTDVGLKDTLGPKGDAVPMKLMVPEKLLTLVTVIVDMPDEP